MKIKSFILMAALALSAKALSVTINVSNAYTDNTSNNDQKTLDGAYSRIIQLEATFPPVTVTQAYEIRILNDVFLSDSETDRLIWNISGTSSYPIKITSYNTTYPKIKRSTADVNKTDYLIELRDANYVTFNGIVFPETTRGIFLNSSSYCNIIDCQFTCNTVAGHTDGGAPIAMGRDCNSADYQPSKYNEILNNKFSGDGCANITGTSGVLPLCLFYHTIYIAVAQYNTIAFNTIINPSNEAIVFFHGYSQYNNVYGNIIDICYGITEKRAAIMLAAQNANFVPDTTSNCPDGVNSTVLGNQIHNNYVSSDAYVSNTDPETYSPNGSEDILIANALTTNNPDYTPNFHNYSTANSIIDPRWVEFNPDYVDGRTAVGDFNGDDIDDIAAMYELAGNSANIVVWLGQADKTFDYRGAWWSSSYGGYTATNVTGRFVAGDFNNDGYDDIATMYDYGSSTSKIHVFSSNGSSSFSSAEKWASGVGSYTAGNVTGRFVAGDFSTDDRDDIAVMYDYGGTTSKIHVFVASSGNFTATEVWTSSSYTASYATYRFVSGNFDSTNKDDIAVLTNAGGSNAVLQIFTSNSTGSTFTKNDRWTSPSAFDVTSVTGRFVSGDFNGSGPDDFAMMRDYGSSTTRIQSLVANNSGGTSYTFDDSEWISASGSYNPAKVSKRFLAGEFSDSGTDDVVSIFDYTLSSSFYRSRFHVWETASGAFSLQNLELGYPWKRSDADVGMSCASGKSAEEEVMNTKEEIPTPTNEPSLYPNPSTADVTLLFAAESGTQYQITIMDVTGKMVLSETVNAEQLQGGYVISTSLLDNGIYLVVLQNGDSRFVEKLVKE